MYPRWAADVAGAGFSGTETFSYDVDVTYHAGGLAGAHPGQLGRVSVAASLPPEAARDFDVDHASMLAGRFPGDTLHVPHRVWALVARY